MSFLDLNLNDVPDLKALPDGEYELRLTDVELRTVNNATSSYNGAQFLLLKFDVPSNIDSKGITHTLFLPRPEDDAKERNNRLRGIKAFCDAFGIDYSNGIDIEAMKGSGVTGWALLKIEESDDYGEQNRIRRFVVGQ